MQPAMYEVIVEKYKGRNLHCTVKIQFTRYFFCLQGILHPLISFFKQIFEQTLMMIEPYSCSRKGPQVRHQRVPAGLAGVEGRELRGYSPPV